MKRTWHIDNRAQISKNFNKILSTLIKSLQINSFIARKGPRTAITQNEKPQRTEK